MKENLFKSWYSRKELQSFLGFGNTKMTQLNKEYEIRKVKIGKKVFSSVEDVEKLFQKNESD
jgi:hypothetical protein